VKSIAKPSGGGCVYDKLVRFVSLFIVLGALYARQAYYHQATSPAVLRVKEYKTNWK
jgi:hypothetical protein